MRKKLRTIKTILILLPVLVTVIAVSISPSSAVLNRQILLYNEDYIYYYNIGGTRIVQPVRNVQ